MDPAASPDQLAALAAALEASWLGTTMRDSTVLYPLVNIMHLLGLVLVVGGIGLLDLRFLGAAHHVTLTELYMPLTAAAALGVGLQIGTGFPLVRLRRDRAGRQRGLQAQDAFVRAGAHECDPLLPALDTARGGLGQ